MATIYNLAGTTSNSFTIGNNGVTIFTGNTAPNEDMGKVGDIYIQKKLNNSDFGRIWRKEMFGSPAVPTWNIIKTYTFDSDIIHDEETPLNSNTWKISIKSANTDENVIDTSSSQANDFTNASNHGFYGVTRYAVDNEVVPTDQVISTFLAGYQNYSYDKEDTDYPKVFDNSSTDKFIALTGKQVAENVQVEMQRAIKVEGKLSSLDDDYFGNDDKVDLVTAINHESKSRDTKDLDLQAQIDAITSKSDVVDVVQYYDKTDPSIDPPPAQGSTDIVHYDTSELGDDDVVKVLVDETHDNAVSYYRFNRTPSTYDVKVASKAALNAYDTSLLHADDIAIVTADESAPSPYTNKTTYYTLSVSGTTKTWVYQGAETESWTYIGSVEAYYTTAQSDENFVHKTAGAWETETIIGTKTFSTGITIPANATLNATNGTITVPTKTQTDNSNNAASTAYVRTAISNEDALVVHLAGAETISDAKTFTGQVLAAGASQVTVPTEQQTENSTKAASTAYVRTAISNVRQVPEWNSTYADKFLAVSHDGTSVFWKEVKDISTLAGLEDTVITTPITTGQTLIYDSSAGVGGSGAWVNGNQISATIKYW